MEWNEKLQMIIDYVEEHLQRKEEPINANEIIRIAECSFDFFQKVFSYMNGISFAEYVRLRKMTLAGYDIKSTNLKVIDISYKYGYDSPTSFTKAFQQFHGVSPKEARNTNVNLKIKPKMQLHQKEEYNWTLIQKDKFRCIGKRVKLPNDNLHISISKFWNDCQRDGSFAKLISLDCGYPKGLFGLCDFYDKKTNEVQYSISVISYHEVPEGFISFEIPKATWAVFDCFGPVPSAIQAGWKYLNEEWLVQYPFKHAKCPELEWYSDGNSFDHKYKSQIWIPILEVE